MRCGGPAWLVGVVSVLAIAVSLTAQQNPPAEAEAAFASMLAAAREAFASRDMDRSSFVVNNRPDLPECGGNAAGARGFGASARCYCG